MKELLQNACKERTKTWDLMKRLGINDISVLGFPTLDETGIHGVHESYQFLCKTYIENEGRSNDNEENSLLKVPKNSITKRRNSCKAKIQVHDNSEKEDGNTKRRNSLGGNLELNRLSVFSLKLNFLHSVPNLPSRSRRGSVASMVSIDESEQLTIDFALLKTEEKLKQDIDAAFSGEMTDFDLDGEVDQIFTSAPTSPKKRAGNLDNIKRLFVSIN